MDESRHPMNAKTLLFGLIALSLCSCGAPQSSSIAQTSEETSEATTSQESSAQKEYDVYTLSALAKARNEGKIGGDAYEGRYIETLGKVTQKSVYSSKNEDGTYKVTGAISHLFIQEGAAAIQVTVMTDPNALPNVGDAVKVHGLLSTRYGMPQISVESALIETDLPCDVKVIDQAIEVNEPLVAANFAEAVASDAALMELTCTVKSVDTGLIGMLAECTFGEDSFYLYGEGREFEQYRTLRNGDRIQISGAFHASSTWKFQSQTHNYVRIYQADSLSTLK